MTDDTQFDRIGSLTDRLGEIQNRESHMGPATSTCQGCGEYFAGRHWSRGRCVDCGAELCFRCWGANQHACRQKLLRETALRSQHSGSKALSTNSSSDAQPKRSRSRTGAEESTDPGRDISQDNAANLAKPLPPDAVSFDEAIFRQLMFTRFIRESVSKLESHPAAPEFKLVNTTYAPEKRGEKQVLLEDFLSAPLKERVARLPKESEFSISAMYKGKRRYLTRIKKTVRLHCFANTNMRELIETGHATPDSGGALAEVLKAQETAPVRDELSLVFGPAGWDMDVVIPSNMVLVSLEEKGDWRFRYAISDPELAAYVDAMFDVESHEEKVEQCVQAVFDQPGVKFPLSARQLAEDQNLPVHMVAEAFRRIAAKERGLFVCDDRDKDDWLLDIC